MSIEFRDLLKDDIRKRVDFSRTPQSRGLPEPPWQKPLPVGAAYDQERMDALLGVDGKDEFTLYLAPVGKADATPENDE